MRPLGFVYVIALLFAAVGRFLFKNIKRPNIRYIRASLVPASGHVL